MQHHQLFPELARLRATFQQGVTRESAWRRAQLQALDKFLVEREHQIAAALHHDLRKSSAEAFLTETGYLRGEIRFALKHLKAWMKPQRVSVPIIYQPAKALSLREPYGVVLIIGAWNYPLQLCLEPLISAIAAGNCAVIKPSEYAPHTASLLAHELPRYLDTNAIRIVEGGVEKSKMLLQERFDYIFYTGGEAVGREVMLAAARHITPVTLELGGKCPCIVDADADITVAARRIVWAKLLNAGQTCLAPDYLLVHESRQAELINAMQRAIHDFYGDDLRQSPDYPRIINEHHVERLMNLLNGELIACGGVADAADQYIAPTILRGVSSDSPLMEAEIFGPLLPVITYAVLTDALELINKGKTPLAVYLFSSNHAVQQMVLRNTRSGGLCINDLLLHAAIPGLPFGGVGASGFGRYHGRAGFETFSVQRSMLRRASFPDPDSRYPPYHGRKFRLLRWLSGGSLVILLEYVTLNNLLFL